MIHHGDRNYSILEGFATEDAGDYQAVWQQ
jgi:hypothetical protein